MDNSIIEFQKSQNIPYITTIEVDINSVGLSSFMFPHDSELGGKTIIGIFIAAPTQTATTSRNGKALLPSSLLDNAFLTLNSCQKDFIKNAPIRMFFVENKPLIYIPIYCKTISLQNCAISLSEKLTAGAGGSNPNYCLPISFIHL